MTNWQRDGIYFLLGFTLTIVFLGMVVLVGGLCLLLLSVIAPVSIRDAMQPFTQILQPILLGLAIGETIAWNLLPKIGFAEPKLAQRFAVVMAGIALFSVISLLFSLL
ncbi:MAG: hypothetical protein MUF72_03285 [Elainella sp. Prado103]|jgi:hypothetical protein|nr:hypothetical protein [Elainella sp. Prado103]